MKREWRIPIALVNLFAVAVVVCLIAGCGSADKTPTVAGVPPEETEVTVPPPTDVRPTEVPLPTEVSPSTEFVCNQVKAGEADAYDPTRYERADDGLYLDGLIVVSGLENDVGSVMAQVLPDIDPIETIPLNDIVIQLFEYGRDYDTVWEAVLAVYWTSLSNGLPVFGDPNYVLADPWDIQGSPWDIQGSPWDIQGSPWAAIAGMQSTNETFYWDQWALDNSKHGIGHKGSGGAGVKIAVFDTSPFAESGHYRYELGQGPDFNVCVSHPLTVINPLGSDEHKNHGLAVAGLVHAVASESEIHLIRVLNDHAEGDMFTLLKGVSLFLDDVLTERGYTYQTAHSEALRDVVINLSLGFRPEWSDPPIFVTGLFDPNISLGEILDNPDYTPEMREKLRALPGWEELSQSGTEDTMTDFRDRLVAFRFLEAGESIPVPALRFLTLFTTDHGAAIAAAAGNESKTEAQRPASWAEVVGVGSSTLTSSGVQPTPSCYSNEAHVLAPGGDGDENCMSQLAFCANNPSTDCPYGLISLRTLTTSHDPRPGPTEASHEFAYHVGTSFATPLVSGQAALLFTGRPSGLTGTAVKARILQTTCSGIVNVPHSLQQAGCP